MTCACWSGHLLQAEAHRVVDEDLPTRASHQMETFPSCPSLPLAYPPPLRPPFPLLTCLLPAYDGYSVNSKASENADMLVNTGEQGNRKAGGNS